MYHYLLAFTASIWYGSPSKRMIVIGVTGTKGKTSSINYIWSVLDAGGIKAGFVTTANVRIGEKEILNPFHMTMPGRFKLQRFLKEMADAKCEVAIVETTSQGISQYRHIGIDYDVAIFTNLSPEHIDAHKTFENYKKTKGELFVVLSKSIAKKFRGKIFPKTIITNADSEHALYFKRARKSRRRMGHAPFCFTSFLDKKKGGMSSSVQFSQHWSDDICRSHVSNKTYNLPFLIGHGRPPF